MKKIEIVEFKNTKIKIDYDKIHKYLSYWFWTLGIILIFTQIIYHGVYQIGEDSTLFIIGLLSIIIGFQIDNKRK